MDTIDQIYSQRRWGHLRLSGNYTFFLFPRANLKCNVYLDYNKARSLDTICRVESGGTVGSISRSGRRLRGRRQPFYHHLCHHQCENSFFYRISCFSLLLRLSSVKWRATVQESDTERKPDILHAHQSRCGHVVLPGDLTNSPSISTGLMGMLSIRSIVEQLDPSVHYTESYPRKMLYTQKVPPQFRISYCRTSICANNKKKFHQNLAKREYNEELYQGMVLKSR